MYVIEKAIELLLKEDYKAVLLNENGDLITSKETGVKFLFSKVNEFNNLKGYVLADKLIGKAAANLVVMLNIKTVFTCIISTSAKEVFKKYHIKYFYFKETEKILNNSETDLCPMEKATLDKESPIDCYLAIKKKLIELKII